MRIGVDVRATQLSHCGLRGLGEYVYTMLDGLLVAAPEHEYVLFTMPGHPVPARLAAHIAAGDCRAVELPTRMLLRNTIVGRLRRVWRLHYVWGEREQRRDLAAAARRARLDVLHIPVPFEGTMFADVGDALRGRCRVVKTAYDLIPLIFAEQIFPPGSGAERFVYDKQLLSYRGADAVVAISASAGDDFARLGGVDPHRIRVVPCAVPPHFASVMDEERLRAGRAKYGLTSPFFLFCSGTGFTKNRPRVVEAFGRFLEGRADRASYQLVFVGPHDDQDEGALKVAAFDAGYGRSQFRVLGYVPNDDLVALFAAALALVTPSLYEGFGLPAAQAMSTGTPVIASNRASHPEVVGDAGLLVDPYDVDAIAGAMTRLADDAALRAELGARGRERARRFTIAAQTRALLQIYGHEEADAPSPRRVPTTQRRVQTTGLGDRTSGSDTQPHAM